MKTHAPSPFPVFTLRREPCRCLISFVLALLLTASAAAQRTDSQTLKAAKADQTELESIQTMIASRPQNWIGYNALGIYYSKRKQNDEAAKAFARSVELNPEDADVLLNLTVTYERMKMWDEALNAVYRVLLIRPNDAEGTQEMCEIYLLSDREKDAAGCYEKLTALVPSSGFFAARYIYSLASTHQFKKGAEVADAALDRFPENAEIYNSVGIMQFTRKDYKSAAGSFGHALKINTDMGVARFNLALASLWCNDRAGAVEQYAIIKVRTPVLAQQLYDVMYRGAVISAAVPKNDR